MTTLPVVGKMSKSLEVTAKMTLPKGEMKLTCSSECTEGLLAYLPPVSVSLDADYDLTNKELTVSCNTQVCHSTWAIETTNTEFSVDNQVF